ncbi:MAG: hypothetical protein IJ856_04215 [Candidatus Methanomethylophilaceae archaeon]|nr:hypothetical protein [Candidatus Methanomethylophilaceae archaeon]
MVLGGRYRDDRRICIICGRTEGTVRTVDGLVCADCMPSELLCDAGRVKTNHIRRFKEENPGWRSVSGIVHGPAPKVEIADRSAAITPATPTTLAAELIA